MFSAMNCRNTRARCGWYLRDMETRCTECSRSTGGKQPSLAGVLPEARIARGVTEDLKNALPLPIYRRSVLTRARLHPQPPPSGAHAAGPVSISH